MFCRLDFGVQGQISKSQNTLFSLSAISWNGIDIQAVNQNDIAVTPLPTVPAGRGEQSANGGFTTTLNLAPLF